MKQAPNSLLTLYPISPKVMAGTPELSREGNGVRYRHLTPIRIYPEVLQQKKAFSRGIYYLPRFSVRFRVGEGRVRSLLHGVFFLWLAACIQPLSFGIAQGNQGLAVQLKGTAAVRSKTVYLKDVAVIKGPNYDQLIKMAQIPLGLSPEFGAIKTLSRHQVKELIISITGPLPSGTLSGAPAVQIRLQGRPIVFNDVAPLLLSLILDTTSWKESEIEIQSIEGLKGIELPFDGARLQLSSRSVIKGHKSILVPIEAVQDGKIIRSFWTACQVAVHAEILAAATRIPRGKIIASSDFVKKSAEIPDLDAVYVRTPEEVLGKVARKTYSPGDPLAREGFMKPYLVMRGETVQLKLERNGIVLTSPVRAEQDGRLGQVIKVRNLDFSAILKAQIIGRGKVEMQ